MATYAVTENLDFRVRQEDDFAGNTSVATTSQKFGWEGLYRVVEYDAHPEDDSRDRAHQQRVYKRRVEWFAEQKRENNETLSESIDPRPDGRLGRWRPHLHGSR